MMPAPYPDLGALLVALFIVTASTWLACAAAPRLAAATGLLDIPAARKAHKRPTPLMGGIVMAGIVMPAAAVWTLLYAPHAWQGLIAGWIILVLIMTGLGLTDDRHSLSAVLRLVFSIAVVAIFCLVMPEYNIRFLEFENPRYAIGFGSTIISTLFTSLCIVGFANAVNMADGKNGVIIGLSLLWCIVLAVRSPAPLWPYYLMLICALVVMLIFNLRNLLFLGDGGSYGLATAVALAGTLIYNLDGEHAGRLISAEELILLFFVPLADFVRLMVVRTMQGRSPMQAGRDHLHHLLQDRFGWPLSLWIYYALALAPVLLIWALD